MAANSPNSALPEVSRLNGRGTTSSRRQRSQPPPQIHMKVVDPSQISTNTDANSWQGAVRGVVSKKKRRFIADGFDLDLTYITERLIAMGFPAENYQRLYRNSMDDTISFFEKRHSDHYWIYNLCSERAYNEEKFKNRVVRFGFDDHNCPIFESMEQLCEHLDEWLSRHPENVAALHCKAGKGRTGLMICVYLIHTGFYEDPEAAMQFYGVNRTKNQKGVTIPSQRRWVHYYATQMRRKVDGSLLRHQSRPYRIKQIILSSTAPKFVKVNVYNDQSLYETYTGGEFLQTRNILVAPDTKKGCVSTSKDAGWKIRHENGLTIIDVPDVEVYKDVKIQFDGGSWGGMKKKRVFSFWFHTDFIDASKPLHLSKDELDKANKTKGLDDFYVEVFFERPDDAATPALAHHLTRKLFPTFSDALGSPPASEPGWLSKIDASQRGKMVETMQLLTGVHDKFNDVVQRKMDDEFQLTAPLSEQLWHYLCRSDMNEPDIPCNKNLNDEQLVVLGVLMQGNLDIKNRVWKNKSFPKTFVGAEAAAWLVEFGFSNEDDIIEIGTRMLENRFFDHVPMSEDDESDVFVFLNSYQLYHFNTSIHTLS